MTSHVVDDVARVGLITLPPEILLLVISHVPTKSFLDLVQTCRLLRNFMKRQAGEICNKTIRTRFPLEAELLKSEFHGGWLVPNHPRIVEEEDLFTREYLNCYSFAKGNPFRYYSLMGRINKTKLKTQGRLGLRISGPGPQYLYFLEHDMVHLHYYEPSSDFNIARNKGILLEPIPARETVTDPDGQIISFCLRLEEERGVIMVRNWGEEFVDFMLGFNKLLVEVKDGELKPCEKFPRVGKWFLRPRQRSLRESARFPRELVWYYGVERLRMDDEKGGWKKTPLLLWE